MKRLAQLAPRPEADTGYVSDLERGMDFSAVFAETAGRNPDLALEVPEWDGPPDDLAEAAWRALHEVPDPEFPVSLPDLGLVYGIEAVDATVRVTVTFTASACPCIEFIKWDIRERLLAEPGIDEVLVEVTWDPPWDTGRISERGRRALRRAGVSL
ncbi:MAG: metal-sulfur cluster assembly factor [Gemmatimonadota bacterium]|nr:metal-sulfur cluster assembly factor [Gemmatimonadota bacterium]